jgi:hypothetical protein
MNPYLFAVTHLSYIFNITDGQSLLKYIENPLYSHQLNKEDKLKDRQEKLTQ